MRRAARHGTSANIWAEFLEDVAQELAVAHDAEPGMMALEDGLGGPALLEFGADRVGVGAKGDPREAPRRPGRQFCHSTSPTVLECLGASFSDIRGRWLSLSREGR